MVGVDVGEGESAGGAASDGEEDEEREVEEGKRFETASRTEVRL